MLLYYYGLRDSIYAELNVSDRCNPILVPLKFGGENLEAREQLEEVKSNADGETARCAAMSCGEL